MKTPSQRGSIREPDRVGWGGVREGHAFCTPPYPCCLWSQRPALQPLPVTRFLDREKLTGRPTTRDRETEAGRQGSTDREIRVKTNRERCRERKRHIENTRTEADAESKKMDREREMNRQAQRWRV